jgi:rRNA maturation endonuclease Nob1
MGTFSFSRRADMSDKNKHEHACSSCGKPYACGGRGCRGHTEFGFCPGCGERLVRKWFGVAHADDKQRSLGRVPRRAA